MHFVVRVGGEKGLAVAGLLPRETVRHVTLSRTVHHASVSPPPAHPHIPDTNRGSRGDTQLVPVEEEGEHQRVDGLCVAPRVQVLAAIQSNSMARASLPPEAQGEPTGEMVMMLR